MPKRDVVVLGALAALCVVVGVLPAADPRRCADVVALLVHAGALLTAALGVRRHRPVVVRAWVAVLALVATGLGASALTVSGTHPSAARWGVVAVQVVALVLVPFVVRTLRRPLGEVRATWPDVLLTVGAGALLVVQVLAMLRAAGPTDPAVLLGTAADVVLAIVLLRILTTRQGMAPATALVLLAAGSLLAVAALVTARADLLTGERHLLQAVQCVAVVLLAAAATHPSMRLVGTPCAGGDLRGEGQRLLSVLPVFCAVPVLWVLGVLGVLPDVVVAVVAPSGYVLACAGVGLAALSVRRAERSAVRDPLTDLVNRRGLPGAAERLRQRLRGEDLHLCLVDLDDFKQINDTRGHAVGDALLVEVAGRLRGAVGPRGVVSRTGGDEFIVVAWTSPDDEEGPADLLLTALDAPFEFSGLPYQVSASIGIAPLRAGVAFDDALVDADVAMYAAKQAGKGRAQVYRPQLREKVLGGLVMQQELRSLLLQNGRPEEVGELVVVHQPIVDLGDDLVPRIVGVEALVRWNHPRSGLVMPDEFLPHAEAAGLGARLDEHVASRALADLARWDAQGLGELHVAVNLGVGSLHRHGMSRWITELAARHGIRPDRVHLEITEHEELPDDPRIAASLREVVAAGFRLDLDDFGIGYTSLSYVRRFPISTVKLDRSLTTLVTGEDTSLLQGISALCRALDMRILAEGVEHAEQIAPLRALGVHRAQGHWFGTAMAAEDVPGYVRRLGRTEDDELLTH
ncbi:putative bifunctional diguanylate cyclase/phosphodiesterase [Kineococcus rhizosphaerae]|uniref:Diguanylate cyclase (GGDEF)-like protein n=1 Tax=Kineococcus rhizosphaerae TaxID=559628 RepID=A0A2T0QWR6_9ACTN|nr:bifunctional diguanylate cyclase/phosphodiesterase [Kineococcus rhizosphaerae]PRY09790.1 diguanylate cyclase (GGDEF)-like protein [Kineococcus rhizosphaerae]